MLSRAFAFCVNIAFLVTWPKTITFVANITYVSGKTVYLFRWRITFLETTQNYTLQIQRKNPSPRVPRPGSYVLRPCPTFSHSPEFSFLDHRNATRIELVGKRIVNQGTPRISSEGVHIGSISDKEKNPGSPGVVIVIINSQSRSSKHRARPMSSSC